MTGGVRRRSRSSSESGVRPSFAIATSHVGNSTPGALPPPIALDPDGGVCPGSVPGLSRVCPHVCPHVPGLSRVCPQREIAAAEIFDDRDFEFSAERDQFGERWPCCEALDSKI